MEHTKNRKTNKQHKTISFWSGRHLYAVNASSYDRRNTEEQYCKTDSPRPKQDVKISIVGAAGIWSNLMNEKRLNEIHRCGGITEPKEKLLPNRVKHDRPDVGTSGQGRVASDDSCDVLDERKEGNKRYGGAKDDQQ